MEKFPFSGWDFSYVSATAKTEPLPWDYRKEVQKAAERKETLLDMDTGGGEFLTSLPKLPVRTFATESYPPNVTSAYKKLKPLNIHITQVDESGALPFKNGSFDTIINRHSIYDPREIYRIAKKDGIFITQQVGSEDWHDLKSALGYQNSLADRWDLDSACEHIEQAGFEIMARNEVTDNRSYFKDVETIIYYLINIPWVIPDFTIDKYFCKLLALHSQSIAQEWLVFLQHRFYLAARKVA
ncbi:MAG: methyltransferase domain-containing protein [candidate division WOR-3 bacterium]|nr:MAG: methyltransferase domain-containing protein [candidate division WOR-3 bacterium]